MCSLLEQNALYPEEHEVSDTLWQRSQDVRTRRGTLT